MFLGWPAPPLRWGREPVRRQSAPRRREKFQTPLAAPWRAGRGHFLAGTALPGSVGMPECPVRPFWWRWRAVWWTEATGLRRNPKSRWRRLWAPAKGIPPSCARDGCPERHSRPGYGGGKGKASWPACPRIARGGRLAWGAAASKTAVCGKGNRRTLAAGAIPGPAGFLRDIRPPFLGGKNPCVFPRPDKRP